MDQFRQPKPAVLREILVDERGGGRSRTRDAVESGSLRFIQCDGCGGSGRIQL
jgi:hypothetical protein